MTRIITRILYIVTSSIYSIFPILLHTTWNISIYTRNFLDYFSDISDFPDYPIKIK